VKKIIKALKNKAKRKLGCQEEVDNFRQLVIDLHLKITRLEKENRRLKKTIKNLSET